MHIESIYVQFTFVKMLKCKNSLLYYSFLIFFPKVAVKVYNLG